MKKVITLRKITYDDTSNIIRWRNKEHVVQNFLNRTLITEELHNNWMKTMVETNKVAQFIIVVDSKDVGTVFLRDIDFKSRKAEFGIFIGEEGYQGQGIGREATRLILTYGFAELDLHKIFLRVLADNKKAVHSYTKNGFIQEGYFKDDIFLDNAYKDIIFMAKFKNDK